MMTPTLYKYRDLENFRFFTDIILNNRLRASYYRDLNDPMEGHYYYINGQLDQSLKDKIYNDKEKIKICSLSKKNNDLLMWSHYSKGHRGVAFGVRIDTGVYAKIKDIQYGPSPLIQTHLVNSMTAETIFTHKLECWRYEEEVRVFIRNQDQDKNFINVEIVELITGKSMSNQDFSFVSKLVEKINPSIQIIRASTFM